MKWNQSRCTEIDFKFQFLALNENKMDERYTHHTAALALMTVSTQLLLMDKINFSWKTREVYEQNDIRLITRCCEKNILQRHEKCQVYDFGDGATGPDEAKY